jgi:hypothetical protein
MSYNANGFLFLDDSLDDGIDHPLSNDNYEQSLIGYDIYLLYNDGPECLTYLDQAMQYVKDETKRKNVDVLGARMYTCNGHGPWADDFMQEEMADAVHFEKQFPITPLLGFYTAREISPMPGAANEPHFPDSVDSAPGSASRLQSYVAVFVFFSCHHRVLRL